MTINRSPKLLKILVQCVSNGPVVGKVLIDNVNSSQLGEARRSAFRRCEMREALLDLTGDTRKIFVSRPETVDESNSARVLLGCKPIILDARRGTASNASRYKESSNLVRCIFGR